MEKLLELLIKEYPKFNWSIEKHEFDTTHNIFGNTKNIVIVIEYETNKEEYGFDIYILLERQ